MGSQDNGPRLRLVLVGANAVPASGNEVAAQVEQAQELSRALVFLHQLSPPVPLGSLQSSSFRLAIKLFFEANGSEYQTGVGGAR